uniref:CD2 molecule n=1 Tax=Loxodonta africana TaxID=9785 RepID=G3TD51_LOXAF
MPCKIFASFLLICNFSMKGAKAMDVVGIVDHDINLAIPDFQLDDSIDDIRWYLGQTRIGQLRKGRNKNLQNETYHIFSNGTLQIKNLTRYSSNSYRVEVFDIYGKNVLDRKIDLRILEMVSKPVISWNCINTTLTCEVKKGSDPELTLSLNKKAVNTSHQKVIIYKWFNNLNPSFSCKAENKVSVETSVANISCTGKGLDVYLILSIIGGGTILIIFVALLIFYISKKKKLSSRRNADEELEIRAHRVTTEERVRKPYQIPASMSQKPAVSQPPPPPSHRSQAPGHRPLPPGHRAQHQQQKRPPPHSSGTHVHQQKGPPLPRPRVQQKPPPGAAGRTLLPPRS